MHGVKGDQPLEHSSFVDRTVLIVDDDVFILAALAEILSEDGYDVHTASNGFSALRQVAELRPAAILLDLMLPERSGQDLLRDLRGEPATRDMAIVVVTRHADGLTDAHVAETDGLVLKPFDETELLITLHRAMQRAAARHAEVPPVTAGLHHEGVSRARLSTAARRSHGRR